MFSENSMKHCENKAFMNVIDFYWHKKMIEQSIRFYNVLISDNFKSSYVRLFGRMTFLENSILFASLKKMIVLQISKYLLVFLSM